MKLHLFCIHDCKAQAFIPPFALPTVALAKRAFTDCINDKNHAFGRNPHDYTLFKCGEFNDDNAQLVALKENLGNGVEFIDRDPSDNRDLFDHYGEDGTLTAKPDGTI